MVRWSPLRLCWQRFPSLARALATTLPVLIVTGYLFLESKKSERLLLEAETARTADHAALQFQGLVSTRLGALTDVSSFVAASPGQAGQENFPTFVQRTLATFPDIQSVSWLDARGQVVQTVVSDQGKNLSSPLSLLPRASEAVVHATTSHQPAATSSFALPGGTTADAQAILTVVPIYRQGDFAGSVVATLLLTPSIRALYGEDLLDFWNLEIQDRTNRIVFCSLPPAADHTLPPPSLLAVRHVPVADHAWRLRLAPTPLMVATLRTPAPLRILTIGLLAALVLGVANYLLAQRRARLSDSLRESERLAEDVEATRRHLSALVNGVDAVIWESDAALREFTFVNDHARKLLGIDTTRPVDSPAAWYEHVHPDDRARVRDNALAALKMRPASPIEYRLVNAEGRVLWMRENVTTISEQDGEVRGLRGVVVDITARVEAEEALQQSQKLESLGVLAGGIAHDFNNLLTTILGNAEMLAPYLKNAASSAGRAYLERIERTTRRLADLTRQMLAYSGRARFSLEKIDLNALIAEMTDLLKVSITKNVRVSYQLHPDLPLLEGDQVQIRQVVLNLLTNAAEAIGSERSGSVVVRTGTRTLDAHTIETLYPGQSIEPGYYAELEVSDDGCGMSTATLSKIFDPFFTTKFTGRGLGLAALRGIVRGHHGGIRIASQEGEGTVFTLVFPACGQLSTEETPVLDTRLSDLGIDDTKVLLVDDEEGLRTLMALALEEAGCHVIQAADGEEGIAQFRRHERDLDIVVLDMTMPRIGGAEVFRRIRAIRPDMRILVCSGYTQDDITRQFDGLGLTGFLEKPFPPSELIEKIGGALAGSPVGGALALQPVRPVGSN